MAKVFLDDGRIVDHRLMGKETVKVAKGKPFVARASLPSGTGHIAKAIDSVAKRVPIDEQIARIKAKCDDLNRRMKGRSIEERKALEERRSALVGKARLLADLFAQGKRYI